MSTQFKSEFLHPRYWPTWLFIGLLRLTQCMPRRLQYSLGRQLGRLLYWLLPGRRHVARTNLKLCFPEWDDAQREQQLRAVFQNNAIGVMETAMAWWAQPAPLQAVTHCVGEQHIRDAVEAGKGVILMGGHYSALDLGATLVKPYSDFECVYRPHNNALFDYWINRGRMRCATGLLHHADMRGIVRSLRRGTVVWFAPDQDQGPKHSIYAPFFNVPAATVTSTARLARMTGAAVIPLAFHRCDDGGYEVEFGAPLERFPSGDDVADAGQVNMALEQMIRKYPAQYMWVHRRFKTHPKGKNYLYR